jgi:hypothetical protein
VAFLQVETYVTDQVRREEPGTHMASPAISSKIDGNMCRFGGAALSVLIHIGLLMLLVEQFRASSDSFQVGRASERGIGSALSVFDLGVPLSETSHDSAQPPPRSMTSKSALIAMRKPTLLELSKASDVQRPEWNVSRVRAVTTIDTPTPVSIANSSQSPVSQQRSAVGTLGFGSGGGDYDPYAGASPQRRQDAVAQSANVSTITQGFGDNLLDYFGLSETRRAEGYALNPAEMSAIADALKRRLPSTRGPLRVSVNVSPTGMVIDVRIANSPLGKSEAEVLRATLTGRKLFNVDQTKSHAQWIDLPEIRLG